MNPFEKYIQKFPDYRAQFEDYDCQPETHELLLRFAQSLPVSQFGIIDLAAGRGRDALFLIESGYPVIAQDVNKLMIRNSLIPDHSRLGDATKLPDADASFGGAMLIDSLLYFSPPQRQRMLGEVYRTLVTGGKLLVISEIVYACYGLFHNKKNNWNIYGYQYSGESYDDYARRIGSYLNKDITIENAQFRSEPDEFSQTASNAGFMEIERQIYPEHTSIAQESRWHNGKYPYFLMILKKLN
jgi:ubiquinone/menaquinone biosynthesis C-methylase UbiE